MQALSADDVDRLKRRVDELTQLQATANAAWKSVRWLPDLTGYARDRGSSSLFSLNAAPVSSSTSANTAPQLTQQLQLGSPLSPTAVNGLPLDALFAPVPPVPDVVASASRRRQQRTHHAAMAAAAAAAAAASEATAAAKSEPCRHRETLVAAQLSAKSGSATVADGRHQQHHAAASSAIGSDSDYHSDISSFSAEYMQSVAATGTLSASATSAPYHYQPVLL
jgi:hypothetical protein